MILCGNKQKNECESNIFLNRSKHKGSQNLSWVPSSTQNHISALWQKQHRGSEKSVGFILQLKNIKQNLYKILRQSNRLDISGSGQSSGYCVCIPVAGCWLISTITANHAARPLTLLIKQIKETCFWLLPFAQGITTAGSHAHLIWQIFMPDALHIVLYCEHKRLYGGPRA